MPVVIKGGTKYEAALASLAVKLARPLTLRVGFLEGATYPNGTPVAMIAAIQNFGTDKIPARPFFSNMVAAKSPDWPAAFAKNLRESNNDVDKSLKLVGEGISGQLRQSIIETNAPPLAASTIARKGFAKPLIDTSVMIGSIDYEVN